MSERTIFHRLSNALWTAVGVCFLNSPLIVSASASNCGDGQPFTCLSEHADAELERLKLAPKADQVASFRALPEFAALLHDGPGATVKQWENNNLPVYDLVLTLLLAEDIDGARIVARAATKPFAQDADGRQISGEQALVQMKQDVRSFYHGEEDMIYARACVSDDAFADLIGGDAELRKGACRMPYDVSSVQRAFGMMQSEKGLSPDQAVEAAMQYAYRVPSCAVAKAIIGDADTPADLGGDAETATWKVLDMATICAAELLIAQNL